VSELCTLTFDDGPDAQWTPLVLDELGRCGARATFFMVGERLALKPGLARAVVAAGHDVELHCHRHVRHTELSETALEQDTRTALRAFERAGLPAPTRWRTPWGVITPDTTRVAERHALELVNWTIDTHDWRGDLSADMLDLASAELGHEAIVLMHDALGPGALRSGCDETVALIVPLVLAARAQGLTVGPLSAATADHSLELFPFSTSSASGTSS
jgi:peptidoglycan/xylan/chitin deacetylase (PgdA/CDA1 family)